MHGRNGRVGPLATEPVVLVNKVVTEFVNQLLHALEKVKKQETAVNDLAKGTKRFKELKTFFLAITFSGVITFFGVKTPLPLILAALSKISSFSN